MSEMIRLQVSLNGTETNPYLKLGVTQNPFSQLSDARYDKYVMQIQKLGGDPIPNKDYIREVLKGFSQEFVELCCIKFQPGEYVKFEVELIV